MNERVKSRSRSMTWQQNGRSKTSSAHPQYQQPTIYRWNRSHPSRGLRYCLRISCTARGTRFSVLKCSSPRAPCDPHKPSSEVRVFNSCGFSHRVLVPTSPLSRPRTTAPARERHAAVWFQSSDSRLALSSRPTNFKFFSTASSSIRISPDQSRDGGHPDVRH